VITPADHWQLMGAQPSLQAQALLLSLVLLLVLLPSSCLPGTPFR
jgi:hypothetical protein